MLLSNMYNIEFLGQPIICSNSNKVKAVEVLSLVKLGFDVINNETFYGEQSLENIKLIVIEQLNWVKSLKTREEIIFSINLSIKCFKDHKFIDEIIYYSKNLNIALEVTDSNIFACDTIKNNILKLKKHSIQLWLDDYNHLYTNCRAFEISWDAIKLDKAYLNNDLHMSKSMSALTTLLKFKFNNIVIEGIEHDPNTYQSIPKEVLYQGYYFSKPLCKNVLTQVLTPSRISVVV